MLRLTKNTQSLMLVYLRHTSLLKSEHHQKLQQLPSLRHGNTVFFFLQVFPLKFINACPWLFALIKNPHFFVKIQLAWLQHFVCVANEGKLRCTVAHWWCLSEMFNLLAATAFCESMPLMLCYHCLTGSTFVCLNLKIHICLTQIWHELM